jgi:hypothetical protein
MPKAAVDPAIEAFTREGIEPGKAHVISNPAPDLHCLPDNSAEWREWMCKSARSGPRAMAMAECSFFDGKLGHRCRPLTAKEHNSLLWALELHPAPTFSDNEGRTIGAWLCPCSPCQERICTWVMGTGVQLTAQHKGEYTFTRISDEAVDMQLCTLGVFEERQQRQIAELSANVAQQVAAQVSAQITMRVKNEVERQMATFFASQRRNTQRTMRQEMLIAESFRQQSETARTESNLGWERD